MFLCFNFNVIVYRVHHVYQKTNWEWSVRWNISEEICEERNWGDRSLGKRSSRRFWFKDSNKRFNSWRKNFSPCPFFICCCSWRKTQVGAGYVGKWLWSFLLLKEVWKTPRRWYLRQLFPRRIKSNKWRRTSTHYWRFGNQRRRIHSIWCLYGCDASDWDN